MSEHPLVQRHVDDALLHAEEVFARRLAEQQASDLLTHCRDLADALAVPMPTWMIEGWGPSMGTGLAWTELLTQVRELQTGEPIERAAIG